MTNIEIQTMDAVKSASRDISKHITSLHNTDMIWEQRRYEIAKDLFVHHETMTAESAVKTAELLIEELRKPKQ